MEKFFINNARELIILTIGIIIGELGMYYSVTDRLYKIVDGYKEVMQQSVKVSTKCVDFAATVVTGDKDE